MFVIIFGRVGQMILALATMRFATIFLSPNEMGHMTLILTVISLCSLFLVSPIGMFITRRLHAWKDSGRLITYFRFHLVFLIIIGVFSASLLWQLMSYGILEFNTSRNWIAALVCSSLVLTTMNQTVISALNIIGCRGWFVWLTLFTGAIGLLLSILLVTYFTEEAVFWIIGGIGGQSIVAGLGWRVLLRKIKMRDIVQGGYLYKELPQLIPSAFSFVWPLSIALALVWMQNQWYRFAFEETLGVYALGIFVAGFGISAGIIGALESILTAYLLPSLYKRVNEAENNEWICAWFEYAVIVLSALLMFVLYICFMASELTRVLVGSMYQTAVKYVAYGALVEFLRVFAGVVAFVAHAKMKTKLLMWPGILGAATSVVVISLLLPIYGELGVAIGLVLAGAMVILSSLFLLVDRSVVVVTWMEVTKLICTGAAFWLITNFFRSLSFITDSMVSAIAMTMSCGVLLLAMLFLLLNKRIRAFAI